MKRLILPIVALTFSAVLAGSHAHAADPPKPGSPTGCNLRSVPLAELLDINNVTEE